MPTPEGVKRFIAAAPDTLWPNQDVYIIQHHFRQVMSHAKKWPIVPYHADGTDALVWNARYYFAVDHFGRIRIVMKSDSLGSIPLDFGGASDGAVESSIALLFPAAPVLTAGEFDAFSDFTSEGCDTWYGDVSIFVPHYFFPCDSTVYAGHWATYGDRCLETLGHFFAALTLLGIPPEAGSLVRIRKN